VTDLAAEPFKGPRFKPEASVGGMGRPKRNRPTKASPARIEEIRSKKCQRCLLCGNGPTEQMPINAAHLIPKGMGGTIGGVWTEANIVGLCGHGNLDGCHALIEKKDRPACHLLRSLLSDAEYSYVVSKMGEQWLDNKYPVIWEGTA
jgi:hypothetical protein